MFKKLSDIGIVAPSPLSFPEESYEINFGYDLGMDILEMIAIGAIFGYVLNMAIKFVDGPSPVLQVLGDLFEVYHGVLGHLLMLRQGMDPHIDIPVHLAYRVFSQVSLGLLSPLPLEFLTLFSDIILVFHA